MSRMQRITTMRTKQRSPFEALEIIRLGRAEWRVSDAANPELLLGFIERQRADLFEVVWMSDPMRWGYAPSFESALVAFGDSVRFAGEILPKRARLASRRANSSRAAAFAPVKRHRATWLAQSDRSGAA